MVHLEERCGPGPFWHFVCAVQFPVVHKLVESVWNSEPAFADRIQPWSIPSAVGLESSCSRSLVHTNPTVRALNPKVIIGFDLKTIVSIRNATANDIMAFSTDFFVEFFFVVNGFAFKTILQ